MRVAEGLKMGKLVDDKGLEEYDTVRTAYDKARTLLQTENPDRKELSDLLAVMDKNPEGAKWLEAEVGEEYGKICKYVPAEKAALVTPAAPIAHSIFKEDKRKSLTTTDKEEIYDIAQIMIYGTIVCGIFIYLSNNMRF